ncbi:Eco57I restriction-modification methylase domain-containing protein [Mycolicibacter sinensis]
MPTPSVDDHNTEFMQFMKDEYPDVKQDLYGAFVVRGIELADRRGLLAIVIGDTWMSIKSFEAMRLQLVNGHAFDSFVHMRDVSNHPDIFGANAAFVLSMAGDRSRHAPFVRLTSLGSERKEQDLRVALVERTKDAGYHLASGEDFAAIPGTPIVYWLSEKMRATFSTGKPLGEISTPLVGLRTGDNNRFMRFWWEVSSDRSAFGCDTLKAAEATGARWFPYNKGGAFRRWYGNHEFVVNWEHDGREIEEGLAERYPYLVPAGKALVRGQGRDRYFSPSVSWSKVSSGAPAFRAYPGGFIFADAGTSIFADTQREREALIAIVNSQVAFELLAALAPTLNFEVGQVSALPVVDHITDEVASRVTVLVTESKSDWDESETSWLFKENPLVALVQDR